MLILEAAVGGADLPHLHPSLQSRCCSLRLPPDSSKPQSINLGCKQTLGPPLRKKAAPSRLCRIWPLPSRSSSGFFPALFVLLIPASSLYTGSFCLDCSSSPHTHFPRQTPHLPSHLNVSRKTFPNCSTHLQEQCLSPFLSFAYV